MWPSERNVEKFVKIASMENTTSNNTGNVDFEEATPVSEKDFG